MPIDLKQVDQLLGRYREFARHIDQENLAAIVSDFNRFKLGVGEVLDKEYEQDRRTALRFNIFELLGVDRVEAKHSDLLADLLDPRGSHGQGPFFLNSFLRYCESKLSTFPTILEREVKRSDFVFVKAEFYSGYGRPDIIAFSRTPAFAVIIENKIDAGDQPQQLERYWRLLERDFALGGTRCALLYLTPSGRDPTDSDDIPPEVAYSCMSYDLHITEWLRSCVNGVPSKLQQTILQYVAVAAQLPAKQTFEREIDEQQK
jgi:hypothetical protein